MKRRLLAVVCVFALLFAGSSTALAWCGTLTVQAPANWEMAPGDSRSLEVTFTNVDDAKRGLLWSTSNPSVAVVDSWGRVTAIAQGTAVITAQNKAERALQHSVTLRVTHDAAPVPAASEVNFGGAAYSEADVETPQKFVDRYTLAQAAADANVPQAIRDCIGAGNVLQPPEAPQLQAVTADGAAWTVEPYGVLRTRAAEPAARNREQRFMGDRYLGDAASPVAAIAPDGGNGIWTINAGGVTHIRMEAFSLQDKAILMSDNTQRFVSRRGMTSGAYGSGENWSSGEYDNDGLWTAMYGAGEIFRFGTLNAQLQQDPNNAALRAQTEAARAVATQSAEAVLLLGNISARSGTAEAYVRYLGNNPSPLFEAYTDYSPLALLAGNDYLIYNIDGAPTYKTMSGNAKMFTPIRPAAWADPSVNTQAAYAKRTRLLTGFVARTYVLSGLESPHLHDGYYYDITGDTAVGMTQKGLKNGEDINGRVVDASLEIPARLMRLINTVKKPGTDTYFSKDDIIYKADTSSDELIGHLFIYKIAYDILGPEDPELKQIITDTTRRLAQHLTDNGYQLADSGGQPTTWGKFNREWLQNGQTFGDAPLHSLVLLCTFKLAAHVTGEKKWEDEYRLAALGKDYAYADLAGEYWDRIFNAFDGLLGGFPISSIVNKDAAEYLARNFLGYSNEEMAMLAYYIIFQLEKDEALLQKYRKGIDAWWNSIQYSENPLWYYIYQLAYPNKECTDAYGNVLVETAAWSLSRHPVDTIKWKASHPLRDDIAVSNIGQALGISADALSYNKKTSIIDESQSGILQAVSLLVGAIDLDYAVAAPDERSLHKYNGSSYKLESDHNPWAMEASTTYTLPYWMGRYHGMLQTQPVQRDKSALLSAVDAQAALNRSADSYTNKSWSAYAAALDRARAVLAKAGATQAEVDRALAALSSAAKGLRCTNIILRLFESICAWFNSCKPRMISWYYRHAPQMEALISWIMEKAEGGE